LSKAREGKNKRKKQNPRAKLVIKCTLKREVGGRKKKRKSGGKTLPHAKTDKPFGSWVRTYQESRMTKGSGGRSPEEGRGGRGSIKGKKNHERKEQWKRNPRK